MQAVGAESLCIATALKQFILAFCKITYDTIIQNLNVDKHTLFVWFQ